MWEGLKTIMYGHEGGKQHLKEFCSEWGTTIGDAPRLIGAGGEFCEAVEWLYDQVVGSNRKLVFTENRKKNRPKWKIVAHPVWGFGKVIKIEGNNEKVTAYFDRVGMKKVLVDAVPGGLKFFVNKCSCGLEIGPQSTRCRKCNIISQRNYVGNLQKTKPKSEWLRTLSPL